MPGLTENQVRPVNQSKFGDVAVRAARLLRERARIAPREAWEQAARRVYLDCETSPAKGCPRDAFLSLCELGAVRGVPAGSYTRSVKNKEYIANALEAVREKESLLHNKERLWRTATRNAEVRHNAQLDVLDALWRTEDVR